LLRRCEEPKLLRMRNFLWLASFAVATLSGALFACTQTALAQIETPRAVLTKLSPPVYPPLARQARITGDVKVELTIQRDGSVASAVLFSGHPILAPAAIESAKHSQFECHACDGVTSYTLTYTFGTSNECHNTPDCSGIEDRPPVVQQSMDHVLITADTLCTCDPAGTGTRIKWRSAKCLYLWNCSSRVIDSQ
jgi:TonB family protein